MSEQLAPTPEVVNEVRQAYNRILKRRSEAEKFLDNPGISNSQKERHLVTFRIEIVNVLEEYLQVLKEWSMEATQDEIMNGFEIK